MSDGKLIGSIRSQGVPVTLTPEFLALAIPDLEFIRFRAKAGSQPGIAEIIAVLEGGTAYKMNLIVD